MYSLQPIAIDTLYHNPKEQSRSQRPTSSGMPHIIVSIFGHGAKAIQRSHSSMPGANHAFERHGTVSPRRDGRLLGVLALSVYKTPKLSPNIENKTHKAEHEDPTDRSDVEPRRESYTL